MPFRNPDRPSIVSRVCRLLHRRDHSNVLFDATAPAAHEAAISGEPKASRAQNWLPGLLTAANSTQRKTTPPNANGTGPQSQAVGTWCLAQTSKIGKEPRPSLSLLREKATILSTPDSTKLQTSCWSSVANLVDALSQGDLVVNEGLCVVFSASKDAYFLLWRSDKEDEALSLLAIEGDGSDASTAVETRNTKSRRAYTLPDEVAVTFKPGPIGVYNGDWKTGRIIEIEKGGQADRLGVSAGMRFKTVNGHAYTESLLDKKISGPTEYMVVFSK